MVEEKKSGLPADIKENLSNLSKRLKVAPTVLVEELKKLISEDAAIIAMTNKEQKIRFGWTLLASRYVGGGKGTDLYITPFSIPRARKTKTNKHVLHIAAMVRLIGTDDEGKEEIGDVELAAGTIWESAAEKSQYMIPGKTYKTSLNTTTVEGGIELGGNDATFIEVDEPKFPTVEKFFADKIEPIIPEIKINLGELDMNARQNFLDIRFVEAMVYDADTGVSGPTNAEYGKYALSDNTLLGDAKKPGNHPFWVHPKDVKYDKGSTLKVVFTVNYDSDKEIARTDVFFTLPGKPAYDRVIRSKEVGQEAVDMSLEDDLIKEHTDSVVGDDFAID